jgi:hypothetical protein
MTSHEWHWFKGTIYWICGRCEQTIIRNCLKRDCQRHAKEIEGTHECER